MFGDQNLHLKFSVKFHHDTPEVVRIGDTEEESVDKIEPDDSTAWVQTQVDLDKEIYGQLSVNPKDNSAVPTATSACLTSVIKYL